MGNDLKKLLLAGPSVLSFIYALTSPIIQIYFMNLVSTQILAFSNLLSVGLAAFVNSTIPNQKIKQFYRDNFSLIIALDIISFCVISLLSVEYVNVRFIGFSIIEAISSNLWCIIMRDAINQVISGDNLTNWNSYSNSFCLWSSLGGGILAMIFTSIDVNTCIAMQCVANIFMGATDYYAYKILKVERSESICNQI
jgi:hypothetical protein